METVVRGRGLFKKTFYVCDNFYELFTKANEIAKSVNNPRHHYYKINGVILDEIDGVFLCFPHGDDTLIFEYKPLSFKKKIKGVQGGDKVSISGYISDLLNDDFPIARGIEKSG